MVVLLPLRVEGFVVDRRSPWGEECGGADEGMMELAKPEMERLRKYSGQPVAVERGRKVIRQRIRSVGPEQVSNRRTGKTTDRIGGTRCKTAGTACEWDRMLEIVSKRDCIVSGAG